MDKVEINKDHLMSHWKVINQFQINPLRNSYRLFARTIRASATGLK